MYVAYTDTMYAQHTCVQYTVNTVLDKIMEMTKEISLFLVVMRCGTMQVDEITHDTHGVQIKKHLFPFYHNTT